MGEVNYMHPLTFEAKYFAEYINNISLNVKVLDIELIEALENVITTIDQFISSKPDVILATKNTKLIKCDNLNYIKRIYSCCRCKMDLGKSSSKVALHLAEECGVQRIPAAEPSIVSVKPPNKPIGSDSEKRKAKEDRRNKREQRKEQHFTQCVTLKKKARQFLTMDNIALYEQLSDSVQIGDKLKCIPDYNVIENDILDLAKPLFPNQSIKVYKFGSRVSGIGSRESDLDIFIDIGETFKIYENRASDATLEKMYKIRDVLKSRQKSWKALVVIDKARVPILKIIHAKSSIECDINFSNSLGYINSLLLEYIFSLQPIARLLCIYMKKWLMRTGLKADFSTYSMNLMVIFYLQHLNFLPPIKKLFENVDLETALIIGPWLGTYIPLTLSDLKLELADSSVLITFIRNLFNFYLAFDFENQVICTYHGKTIKKKTLHTVMPSRYTIFVQNNKGCEIELVRSMTIQDPIQLNHNVAKGVSEFGLRVFKDLMLKSWQMITNVKK